MKCPVCQSLFTVILGTERSLCLICRSEWKKDGVVVKEGIAPGKEPPELPNGMFTEGDLSDFMSGLPPDAKESLRGLGFDV